MKISSILIAKNEESNIEKCIKSLLLCIDDIHIFVDQSSDDRTYELASKFQNIQLHKIEWKGFSATKNEALKFTSNNWVFWIDADEVITDELAKEIVIFKETNPDNPVYSIPRKAFFLGKWIKHCGWYPDRVNRLFDKTKASFSENTVHEFLIFNGQTGQLNNDLEHYTDPSISHYFKKFNLYTGLAAAELKSKNRNSGLNDILLRPVFIFIKMYFLKLGFLDGIQGFILSVFSALYVFTKYCKLWELNKSGD